MLEQLSQQLRKFVASAQQTSHSDDAVTLAQDCSQGSAHLPSAGPRAALFPGELTNSLPLSKGGVGLVHVPTQIQFIFPPFFTGEFLTPHQMTKVPNEPGLSPNNGLEHAFSQWQASCPLYASWC